MAFESFLTLKEILNRPTFARAKVIAGHNGLHRRVRWVHILEVSEFDTLINGEEMILATGINFKSSSVSPAHYLKKLIHLNASCLCLELGYYFHEIPDELIQIANQHDFPLIAFPNQIRFVDITQDLHAVIINQHVQLLQNLETLSREFHRLSLEPKGTANILKMLYNKTSSPIIYISGKGKLSLFPDDHPKEKTSLSRFLENRLATFDEKDPELTPAHSWSFEEQYVLLQPIRAMGQTLAYIGMICSRKPTRYEYLILDWSALAIAQDLIRKKYMEERRLHSENAWVNNLLHNRLDESQIRKHLHADYNDLNNRQSFVTLIEWNRPIGEEQETPLETPEYIRYDFPVIIRSAFEQYRFFPLITRNHEQIAIIAFDLNSQISWKQRVRQLLEQIRSTSRKKRQDHPLFNAGVGQRYTGFAFINQSFREADQVLDLNDRQDDAFVFYDELGIFQLILNLKEDSQLKSYISQHLGSVIEYDRQKNSDLLYTLKVYLDHDCSKKAAAEHLYIVRQSLYYRLRKLKELLGDHFLSTENKLTLQVALRACQLVYPELLTNRSKKRGNLQ
ncbi:PucR family transcriptional regulator [Thermoactinomyces mirandus]|uniref:PucR family transcriptional regulator ligand-binding domain-containing protein n=1 Tax=Thermoactinomyces mirandus TaxID=2756294 RepID=A0A7W2ASM5_9BACL|nr:PucR family transcriptional regulator [Thermoactinomyces mirandus]MBA4602825.1 PucR family transcriptional regulator ligand-binding domain-containing protein [Thermoactinomyces mirandus]